MPADSSENRIGLAFPLKFSKGDRGSLIGCTREEHIKQSIRTLLLTGNSQRVMRPDFGSRAGEFLFENISATTSALIRHEIRRAIENYEPRVELIDIKVSGSRDPGVLITEITYTVLETGVTDQLSVDLRR